MAYRLLGINEAGDNNTPVYVDENYVTKACTNVEATTLGGKTLSDIQMEGGFCVGSGTKWGKILEGVYNSTSIVDECTIIMFSKYYTKSDGLMGLLMLDFRGNATTAITNASAKWILRTYDITPEVAVTYTSENDILYVRIYVQTTGWKGLSAKIIDSHGWSASGTMKWNTYSAIYEGGAVATFDTIPSGETSVSITDKVPLNTVSNADTVDGKHASAFSLSGHTHSYLPLSGGTLTGTLNSREITPTANSTYSLGTSSLQFKDVYGTTFYSVNSYNVSDVSKKKNITDVSYDDVERLFGTENGYIREYNWRVNDQHAVGVVAQEIEEFIPEAVDTNEDGLKTVNYNVALSKIVGCMFKKIKELENTVNEQRKLLNNLTGKTL